MNKKYQKLQKEMDKLSRRRIQLSHELTEAKDQLTAYRKVSAQSLIDGKDSSKVADQLASADRRVVLLQSAVAEIDNQIVAIEPDWRSESEAYEREIDRKKQMRTRRKLVKVLKVFENLQLELARIDIQAQHTPISVSIKEVQDALCRPQTYIERDPEIVELSNVPSAQPIGGWLDDKVTATRGAQILDWAYQEVRK